MQQECIPQAMLGMDVICQAKSGMGKTAVFVLSILHQIEPVSGQIAGLVLCHTRELTYQVCFANPFFFCVDSIIIVHCFVGARILYFLFFWHRNNVILIF